MTRKEGLEARLARIRATGDDPQGGLAILRQGLRSNTGVAIAAAARIAAEAGLAELDDEYAPAFERLVERPAKRDPGCTGKLALARALCTRGRWEESVFPVGIRYVQPEPVWGGSRDTAAELRGQCGIAYVELGRLDAAVELAVLLADPERPARVAAARALGGLTPAVGQPLLRHVAARGDDESEVLMEAFASLLALGETTSFVAAFLDRPPLCAEAAALALGESRRADATEPLIGWLDRLGDPAVGCLALAMLRREEATDYLLRRVRHGDEPALRALATFRHDADLRRRVLDAAGKRHAALAGRFFEG